MVDILCFFHIILSMSKVFILIGCVGAGKTTCANKLKLEKNTIVISADEIYKTLPLKKISTKPYDHKIRNKILNKMYAELERNLSANINCVIDYTNMPTRRRHKFLMIAKRHSAEIVCKLLLVDKLTCLNQMLKRETNNSASHKIKDKETTIDLYFKRIKNNLPTLHEGFDVIETYYNGQLYSVKQNAKHKKTKPKN